MTGSRNDAPLFTVEERAALLAGYSCGVCLDFGWLDGLGPCPRCRPDAYAEHILTREDDGEVVA